MDIVAHEPAAFSELAGPWMSRDPFSTNVIGVHLAGVLAGHIPGGPEDLWLTIGEDLGLFRFSRGLRTP